MIDPDALKVVHRLTRHGFEAYLVGGGVRDLLLGHRPKDFDIATSARPENVRRLFRNSRVIGRRFRLVHVLFPQGKIIEVATFRRGFEQPGSDEPLSSPDGSLLIRADNHYGQAHEDAIRRDLTINALLYDVMRKEVLDYVGAMEDIRGRVIRTIGDPHLRFLEDPARMLRSIKFGARLDLGILPEVLEAIVDCRGSILQVARPRLLEELFKLLRSGAAKRALWIAWELRLLHEVLPETAALLDKDHADSVAVRRFWTGLGALDRQVVLRHAPPQDPVLLTLLVMDLVLDEIDGSRDRVKSARTALEPLFIRLAVPRRIGDAVCKLLAVWPKMEHGLPARFARSDVFPLAQELLKVRTPPEPRAPKPRKAARKPAAASRS